MCVRGVSPHWTLLRSFEQFLYLTHGNPTCDFCYYYDENMVMMILLLPHCRHLGMMLMMMISQACPCDAPMAVVHLFLREQRPNRSIRVGSGVFLII